MSCNHVQRPAAARAMGPAQLARTSARYMDVLFATASTGHPLSVAVADILASGKRPLYNETMAEVLLTHQRFIYTPEAKMFFLEMSVDAFLNHDFPGSRTFYSMYIVLDEALRCESLEHFLQGCLDVVTTAHPHASKMITPWGTSCIVWPAGTSEEDVQQPQYNMLERLSKSTSTKTIYCKRCYPTH